MNSSYSKEERLAAIGYLKQLQEMACAANDNRTKRALAASLSAILAFLVAEQSDTVYDAVLANFKKQVSKAREFIAESDAEEDAKKTKTANEMAVAAAADAMIGDGAARAGAEADEAMRKMMGKLVD